jgi:hypothetical protein
MSGPWEDYQPNKQAGPWDDFKKSDAPQVSAGEDAAKSVASGLGQATIGTLGMGGDLRNLASSGLDAAANKIGFDPSYIKSGLSAASKVIPGLGVIANAPSSADIKSTVTNPIVDPDYKPQTGLGGYLKTGAEFLPGMVDPELAGPAAFRAAAKLFATRVAAPAVASETAGKLTEGTAAEPYARIAGAGLGGYAAAKMAEARAASSLSKSAAPALQDLKSGTSAGYDTLTAGNVATPLGAGKLDAIADDLKDVLNRKGIRPSNAAGIHNAVDEIRTPATAGAPDVADLVAARQSIKTLLSDPSTNKAGAFVALGKIEKEIEAANPGTMSKINELDKNWSAVKANEALDKKMARADLRAAGADSGLNLGNKIRQKVADYLLSSEAKYLSTENKKELEKIVRGTWTQNGMRLLSGMMGGGGGIGSTVVGLGAAGAGQATGHPEAALLPIGGIGLRMATNRSVANQAAKAAQNIRLRSPQGQQNLAALPAPGRLSIPKALLPALLSSASQVPGLYGK